MQIENKEKNRKNIVERVDNPEKWCILLLVVITERNDNSGGVAQLVEQRTENPCVTGSIPVLATIFFARFSVVSS